jgi:hypothetical protein
MIIDPASLLTHSVQLNRCHLVVALAESRDVSNKGTPPFKDTSKALVGSRTVRGSDGPFDLPISSATSILFDERDKSRE